VWKGSPVPEALSAKLAEGGAVVFSSAAALTLGRFSVPVYEIYKVGQPAHWLDGLDLMKRPASRARAWSSRTTTTPRAAPTTRTSATWASAGCRQWRRCFRRRLGARHRRHTVLVVDLEARTVVVSGRGGLTVRRRGASQVFAAGQRLELDALLAAARGDATRARASEPARAAAGAGAPEAEKAPGSGSPLLAEVARLEQAFESAIAGRKASEAAEAILTLDGGSPNGRRTRCRPTSPIELGPSCTPWFSGWARPPRAVFATRASSWLRWSRTSSPFEASCAPRAPSSSPTGCATA